MIIFNPTLVAKILIALLLTFPLAVFAGETNALREEARKLYKVETNFVQKCLANDFKGIYSFQHPTYRDNVSFDEFVFFDGKAMFDYRSDYRARVSGGYVLPSFEYIRQNKGKKDILGFPTPRKYKLTTNPLVDIREVIIKSIDVSQDKKYAKVNSRYKGKMMLEPGIHHGLMKIPFDVAMIDFWENVNGQWFITLMKSTANISGYPFFYGMPNDGSAWESKEFTSFQVSDLTNDKN